jgi:arylsulfatase A-like enzyme
MKKPNIIVILNDDMGYSDIGCYGGEVNTPHLDGLAREGIRFSQFYNSPRCSPTRASLLTGLHPHQTGVGILTENQLPDGYPGDMNRQGVTLAELLQPQGYSTYMSGKWHVAHNWDTDKSNWPCQRGFDRFYGLIAGAASYYSPLTLTRDNDNIEQEALNDKDYYLTNAISDNAVSFINDHATQNPLGEKPFFMYVAYTASHWPLHAFEEDIAPYKGRFDAGWDKLREERLERMVDLGLISPDWKLTERDETQPAWEKAENKEWEARRMEVYAAQIDVMDRGIGRIVDSLKQQGLYENTLIMFLADNGACAEVLTPQWADNLIKGRIATEYTKTGERVTLGNIPTIMPGAEDNYQSYGIAWANLSNTPFRFYKHWTHEGGISTPFIAHWPDRIKERGVIRHAPAQLTDIMATVVDITGSDYPEEYKGNTILPMEGTSLTPLFDKDNRERGTLFWEHEGNGAVREGKWKLVKKYPHKWELYDMEADRTEINDLSGKYPERVDAMREAYEQWAERCQVIPREVIEQIGAKK